MKKKLLIIFGGFILAVFIFGFLGWFLVFKVMLSKDYRKNYDLAEARGREFGKTVEQEGCITEGLRRTKDIGGLDLEKHVMLNTFVESCLRTSKPVQGFCDDVPGLFSLREIDYEEAMCKKVGMEDDMVCEVVFDAKHTICNFP